MTAKEFLERWDTEICPMVSYDAKKIHALNDKSFWMEELQHYRK